MKDKIIFWGQCNSLSKSPRLLFKGGKNERGGMLALKFFNQTKWNLKIIKHHVAGVWFLTNVDTKIQQLSTNNKLKKITSDLLISRERKSVDYHPNSILIDHLALRCRVSRKGNDSIG